MLLKANKESQCLQNQLDALGWAYTTHMEPLVTDISSNHFVIHFRSQHVTVAVQVYPLIKGIILTVAIGKRTVGKGCEVFVFKHMARCCLILSWWNIILVKSSPLAAWLAKTMAKRPQDVYPICCCTGGTFTHRNVWPLSGATSLQNLYTVANCICKDEDSLPPLYMLS